MTNYDVLKETKIIYEYFNNLLNNGNFEIKNENMLHINKAMDIIKDMYENTYHLMYVNKEEYEVLKTDLQCPCCNKKILISDLINYAYVCDRCDENFYLSEVDSGNEWYFENRIDKNLDAETYSIEIWETEELREKGESFIYLDTYHSKEEAILKAKKIINKHNYAYIAVINDNDNSTIFETDGIEEIYHNKTDYRNKIYKVSKVELNKYINDWSNKQLSENCYDLLYCEDKNKYIAIDNVSGDCYVEEFETEAQAVFWLDTDMLSEEIPYSTIPKRILESVIDTTKNQENDYENIEGVLK